MLPGYLVYPGSSLFDKKFKNTICYLMIPWYDIRNQFDIE